MVSEPIGPDLDHEVSSAETLFSPVRAQSGWEAGRRLPGDLRLLERIGHGGMAEVWKAWSLRLQRPAAVKRLLADQRGPEAEWREGVLREARAAARLRHPAIIEIFDCAVDDGGQPFVVMEWIDGVDLLTLIDRYGRLPAALAVRLMLPVAAGLAAAHRRGVVHGDVKPGNVLFGRQPGSPIRQVKLIDFGIARVDGGGVRAGPVFTPDYAAPEQIGTGQGSVSADQWSFCVSLYQLCTGRSPFQGATFFELFEAIDRAPLPFPLDVDLDGDLFRILARGTRKRSEDRYPDIAALHGELARWLDARGIRADAAGRSIRTGPTPTDRENGQ